MRIANSIEYPEEALELDFAGIRVARERTYELYHRGVRVGTYRADLVVDDRVIIEVKTGPHLEPSARRQLLNYLRVADLRLGLVAYFGPDGASVKRVIWSPGFRPRDNSNEPT